MAGQPYIQFGSGILLLNPNAGNLVTNYTPVKPLTIQDVKIEQKGKIESLLGQNQYPDDTATGDKTGTFEFAMGRNDYFLLNEIFNADTVATGGTSVVYNEVHAIPATPYQITPTPPGSGTFATDLGVTVTLNNQEMVRLPSGTPAAGQYTVTAGVYLFSAADHTSALSVAISYSYTLAAGNTYQINNQVQGYGPAFEAYLVETYEPVGAAGSYVYSVVRLYAAKISDVSKDNKRSGYSMIGLKGSYYASANGRVIDFYSNV